MKMSIVSPATSCISHWTMDDKESGIDALVLSNIGKLVPYRYCSEVEQSHVLSGVRRFNLYTRGMDTISQKLRTYQPKFAKLTKADLYILRQVSLLVLTSQTTLNALLFHLVQGDVTQLRNDFILAWGVWLLDSHGTDMFTRWFESIFNPLLAVIEKKVAQLLHRNFVPPVVSPSPSESPFPKPSPSQWPLPHVCRPQHLQEKRQDYSIYKARSQVHSRWTGSAPRVKSLPTTPYPTFLKDSGSDSQSCSSKSNTAESLIQAQGSSSSSSNFKTRKFVVSSQDSQKENISSSAISSVSLIQATSSSKRETRGFGVPFQESRKANVSSLSSQPISGWGTDKSTAHLREVLQAGHTNLFPTTVHGLEPKTQQIVIKAPRSVSTKGGQVAKLGRDPTGKKSTSGKLGFKPPPTWPKYAAIHPGNSQFDVPDHLSLRAQYFASLRDVKGSSKEPVSQSSVVLPEQPPSPLDDSGPRSYLVAEPPLPIRQPMTRAEPNIDTESNMASCYTRRYPGRPIPR
ncbi:hypothetical protein K435DRAFT_838962 [Dendrothele bispora CBS 962.96]|uniref:Uncharacterized protein n=1 Tax=Dendrothele bispora (strain CBS 962.96) TaxID=1314807 RepID=A0A4S8M480_DENBC|nr:hypothetical protein K435DRAFT_838962 [Dendrothele bispora CBS 962.96]